MRGECIHVHISEEAWCSNHCPPYYRLQVLFRGGQNRPEVDACELQATCSGSLRFVRSGLVSSVATGEHVIASVTLVLSYLVGLG